MIAGLHAYICVRDGFRGENTYYLRDKSGFEFEAYRSSSDEKETCNLIEKITSKSVTYSVSNSNIKVYLKTVFSEGVKVNPILNW